MTEAQLRAFATVAECGGFGEAARRLHMSQPGVSRAVRALEGELGGDLFVRGRSAAVLTTLGERALVRARAILAEASAMRHERDEVCGIASGRVRLGSMPSVSATILPALLSSLERRHPALSVTVVDGHDDELVAWARAGTVDVAVVAGAHDGLELQPLVVDDLLAVVPAAHPLAAHAAVPARALVGEPFILTRAGCERLVLAALRAQGVTPNVGHEVSEASSILALVGEGLGVSVMPGLAARPAPPTVALRPLAPAAERRLALATPARRAPSPAVRAFLAEAMRYAASADRGRAPAAIG
jgi:DNA-binding transcriptional LysR family regulator